MRTQYLIVGLVVALGCGPAAPGTHGETDTGGDGDPGDGDGDPGDGDGDSDATYVFDQNELRTYELEISPPNWALLNEDPTAEIYVPAQLHFEGQTWGPIGVRYKGGYGSLYWCFDGQGNQVCPKISMKLKFTEYSEGPLFYGLKRLNFHAMSGAGGGDTSKLHDRLGYNLFLDNGVIAPRAVHARLLINGELVGLFIVVEQIDGRFTDDRFPSDGDGNVYKEIWPIHQWEGPYLGALKTNEDQDPSAAKMVTFASALAAGGDAGFNGVIEQWMDADALMRYIAVDRAIENWDGIVGLYGLPAGNHNYYWYEEGLADRVWLIPWDLDHTFDYPNPIVTNYGAPAWNEVPQSCAGIPTFGGVSRYPAMCDDFIRRIVTQRHDEWTAAAQELLNTLYTQDELDSRVDFYANQIDAAVQEDPDLDYAQWQTAVDWLRADLLGLRDQLQAQIDG
ncbi:CotH kinase family protein [Enhygromyxa salina]|uniref:CotH protein n=1 Tax=Enhygromyxa salina TaxID=215803 RepID=A0A2S9YPS2_9BACT|nr:CotH kinase family protein [Enhygromyxa salina]PRQ07091.1 CotH protein [Enhygromyxa salina]